MCIPFIKRELLDRLDNTRQASELSSRKIGEKFSRYPISDSVMLQALGGKNSVRLIHNTLASVLLGIQNQ